MVARLLLWDALQGMIEGFDANRCPFPIVGKRARWDHDVVAACEERVVDLDGQAGIDDRLVFLV
jgi:hypothetical protein